MEPAGQCLPTSNQGEPPLPALPLPGSFLKFLEENGIDPSIYVPDDSIPRYIRVKPGYECNLLEIEDELKCKLQRVDWLPGFFAIPPQIQIAGSNAYRQGKIYGMDAASGAAVLALNASPGDHVLDLCAAPGAKLCMLSEILGSTGSITGVDISSHRLAACRTMLQKYKVGDLCRLFVADGTTFSLLPVRANSDLISCVNAIEDGSDVIKEWSSKSRWAKRKDAKKARHVNMVSEINEPDLIFYGRHSGAVGLRRSKLFEIRCDSEISELGYDKVLVDAECTHDGSIKHVHKFDHWGWETLQHRLLDAERISNLMDLQSQLLGNGFRLLKVGGTLVYSTCSLTVTQNESVVEQFLSRNSSAEVQEIEAARNWPCRSGRIEGTLRFDPTTSQTSGLFIAKLVKITR